MTIAANGSEASVFISYSRRDAADFVDDLNISLETCGFSAYFDKQDIAEGEVWEERLRSLISSSDTTLCVITEKWIESTECVKELDIALDLGRRVIPILKQPIDPSHLPPALSRLQFVFFCGEGATYAKGVAALVKALRTDITWIREQSRYLSLAQVWDERGRSNAYLLREDALAEARSWLERPTPDKVIIHPLVTEFISASENSETLRERKRLRGRIRTIGMSSLTIVSLLGAGLAFSMNQTFRAQETAEVKTAEAEVARQEAQDIEIEATRQIGEQRLLQEQIIYQQQEIAPAQPYIMPREDGNTTDPEDETETVQPAPGPRPTAPIRVPVTREPVYPQSTIRPVITGEPENTYTDKELRQLVADLNSTEARTRLSAGQDIANLVRQEPNDRILKMLMDSLGEKQVSTLTTNGRFNILYMLNLANQQDLRDTLGKELYARLEYMENDASRTKGRYIGGQTQDCLDSLYAKLEGKEAKMVCGGK